MAIWLAIGVAVGVAFLFLGIDRIDHAARGSYGREDFMTYTPCAASLSRVVIRIRPPVAPHECTVTIRGPGEKSERKM